MTQINHQAVTASLADTLGRLQASQDAVKQAAAAVYTPPEAPAVPNSGQGMSDAAPGGAS